MTQEKLLEAIFTYCDNQGWFTLGLISDILILVTGVLANTALLWLFLRERKPLSASQVLGVNIVAMDLIYLSIIPASLIFDAMETKEGNETSKALSLSDLQESNTTDLMQVARDCFDKFNLIGCPLLLSCMCIERYLAVVRPVLYLKLRKWEYRMAVSAAVWVITLSFCVASGTLDDSSLMIILIPLTISCLFILMLTCLCGVIRSLLQQSPAHTTAGYQACSSVPLKRKAVYNVLAVVVPAVISYLPILPFIPLVIYIRYQHTALNRMMCHIIETTVFFPRFGVFIGPLFYLSRARQMCFLCRDQPQTV